MMCRKQFARDDDLTPTSFSPSIRAACDMGLLTYVYPALTFILSLFYCASQKAPLLVHLTSGSFEGATNGSVDIWLGIPFAQPPVGSLRFKAPVPITNPAPGVKAANQFGNVCPQLPSDALGAPMSEDCLYLNVRATTDELQTDNRRITQVFRPVGTTADDKLPVIAYLYVSAIRSCR